MIRLIYFAFVVYLLIRLVWRVALSLRPRPKGGKPKGTHYSSQAQQPRPGRSGVIDEMKRCPACGTYNPSRLSCRKKDLYFCNERCHEHFSQGERDLHENFHRHGRRERNPRGP